jgi:hypothetical protein
MMGGMGDDRSSGVSRGGRYALCHLWASALAMLVFFAVPSDAARLPIMVLGFPVLYLPWLLGGVVEHWPPAVTLLLGLCLMAANSYLWGHAIAWVHSRWAGKEP